jgi:hypothetical protein
MTPKQKAKELMLKYVIYVRYYDDYEHIDDRTKIKAKQCALIAVEEILNSGKDVDEFCDSYWQEVKKEIELL